MNVTLKKVTGIIRTRTNDKCAALVIRYNPDFITPEHVYEALREIVAVHTTKICPIKDKTECGCPQVKGALRYFSFVSAVGGAVLVSESLLGITVAQTLLSRWVPYYTGGGSAG